MRRIREYTEFGFWACGILMELNMTQAELAKAVGAGRSTVTDTFTGRTKNGGQLRERIAAYLEGEMEAEKKKGSGSGKTRKEPIQKTGPATFTNTQI